METEIFVDSLGSVLFSSIKIDYIPFLGFASIVTPYLNWVSFFVLSSSDIKYLSVLGVHKLFSLVFEDLVPC
jgi:hypothetical protein